MTRATFLKVCVFCMLLSGYAVAQEQPSRVLLVGDSTVGPLAFGLDYLRKEQAERSADIKVRTLFRNASGLARPDFYDWPKVAKEALTLQAPDVAIVCLGANDTQPLLPLGQTERVQMFSEAWRAEYVRRVEAFARLFVQKSARVYFLLPSFDPNRKYAPAMQEVSDAIRFAAASLGIGVIDAPALLADDAGQFQASAPTPSGKLYALRAPDGVHLSPFGGVYLARGILRTLAEERQRNLPIAQMMLK